jgi:hypothetical protein
MLHLVGNVSTQELRLIRQFEHHASRMPNVSNGIVQSDETDDGRTVVWASANNGVQFACGIGSDLESALYDMQALFNVNVMRILDEDLLPIGTQSIDTSMLSISSSELREYAF